MTSHNDIRLARNLWRVTEPYHQLSYRSPEAEEEYVALGLDRPELRYFGSRLAALGPIGLHTATAVLYGFGPTYIAKAIPELWSIAEPIDISRARLTGAQRTLQRIIGDVTETQEMTKAGAIGRAFVEATDFAGRPVGAAHADLLMRNMLLTRHNGEAWCRPNELLIPKLSDVAQRRAAGDGGR